MKIIIKKRLIYYFFTGMVFFATSVFLKEISSGGSKKIFQEISDLEKVKIGDLSDCNGITGVIGDPQGYFFEMKDINGKSLHCVKDSDFPLSGVESVRSESFEKEFSAYEDPVFSSVSAAKPDSLRVESSPTGGVFAENCPGGMVTASECANPFYIDIKFSSPFKEPPSVIVSPLELTSDATIGGATDKIYTRASDVTERGFRLHCSGSPLNTGYSSRGKCSWLAIGI